MPVDSWEELDDGDVPESWEELEEDRTPPENETAAQATSDVAADQAAVRAASEPTEVATGQGSLRNSDFSALALAGLEPEAARINKTDWLACARAYLGNLAWRSMLKKTSIYGRVMGAPKPWSRVCMARRVRLGRGRASCVSSCMRRTRTRSYSDASDTELRVR